MSYNSNFERELQQLINKYSIENDSNTPDWVLARLLCRTLDIFREIMINRDSWHGNNSIPSGE